ncbi:MAG: MBL fold metallo-hydrolase [Sphingomicrobium sp.]
MLINGTPILVDAGDGASVQLAKAHINLTDLRTVIISHLHFDHTAGLFGIISERYQLISPGSLTIYGPPGTRATVDGFLAAMLPSPPAGARARGPAKEYVNVVEVGDGSRFNVAGITVSAVANSHYTAMRDRAGYVSLSYRFDVPGRSIVYTGDTGPSIKLERLARDCDLLISEIIDVDRALARVRQTRPDVSPTILAGVRTHFAEEHLTAEHVGELAAGARVKELVLTHNATSPSATWQLQPGIRRSYRGPIHFARDLDRF